MNIMGNNINRLFETHTNRRQLLFTGTIAGAMAFVLFLSSNQSNNTPLNAFFAGCLWGTLMKISYSIGKILDLAEESQKEMEHSRGPGLV